MGILMRGRDLQKMVKENGLAWTKHHIQEAFDSKQITPEDFSLRDMYRGMVDGGSEMIANWERELQRGGASITESIDAVDTGAMANITGQIFYNAILDAMSLENFIGDTLVSTFQSNLQDEEKVPGIGIVADEFAGNVAEGKPYPTVGLSENFITIPAAEKKGGIIGVTKEALIADRTGLLIERMRTLGGALGIRKEKSIIDVVIGAVNPYSYKNEARLTYGDGATAGQALGFINTATPALVNYSDVQDIAEIYYAILEQDTNEPLSHAPTTLICTGHLSWTASAVFTDVQVRLGNIAAAPGIQSIGTNRIPDPFRVAVTTTEYVTQRLLLANGGPGGIVAGNRAAANAYWFIGNPQMAFVWKEIWPLTVIEEPTNAVVSFEQDIVLRFKASYKGVAGVKNPRFMIRSDGTT